ncbi:hypothetical protein HGP28_04255 [Vibrio sp. SM6]|uniref:Uncharacterized protein n=1 Tax=Vibrio agarilyticus TaxID=2726741 RepID=A0A7X8TP20_9VIBR|nr:hypothetical protein [Vibrio agarilyticus]NLS12105.1 hypothetical protein [Vibrio agarilyticus]
MQKGISSLTLMLSIPIVLLVLVAVAAVYRFSLGDDAILAKVTPTSNDEIIEKVLKLDVPNPWTVTVPKTHAFALLDHYDDQVQQVRGRYDGGSWRGEVIVDTAQLLAWPNQEGWFVAPLLITQDGGDQFKYLALFGYDPTPKRVILADALSLPPPPLYDVTGMRFDGELLQVLLSNVTKVSTTSPAKVKWSVIKAAKTLRLSQDHQ